MSCSLCNNSTRLPLISGNLYIGIDIAKKVHVAGLISTEILAEYKYFEGCPTFSFNQSLDGFKSLINLIKTISSLERCHIVIEATGPYSRPIEQFLINSGAQVYRLHPRKRVGLTKSDRRDALILTNSLYNQLEKEVQFPDKRDVARHVLAPTEPSSLLKPLVHHREIIVREATRIRNRLTSIYDEIFPEFTEIYKDSNGKSALNIRKRFPTPADIAQASIEDLLATRERDIPSEDQLIALQALARNSIAVTQTPRLRSLVVLQNQLIDQLMLLNQQLHSLNKDIASIVSDSREGKIITSIPGVGTIIAAYIIASVKDINNFPSISNFRSYCGFGSKKDQSGSGKDIDYPAHRGNPLLKKMLILSSWHATHQEDSVFFSIYQDKLKSKCTFNHKKGDYSGKMKAYYRVAVRVTNVIYSLLKKDQELLAQCSSDQSSPEPELYNPEIHRHHCAGHHQAGASSLRRG